MTEAYKTLLAENEAIGFGATVLPQDPPYPLNSSVLTAKLQLVWTPTLLLLLGGTFTSQSYPHGKGCAFRQRLNSEPLPG
jgi:hypothetical protein